MAWSGRPRVIAHRGASLECPENTLAAFRRALDLGAPALECDVHLSRDGVPVVHHDATVDRTTNGTGAVGDLSAAKLASLDAGAKFGAEFRGESIPTLDSVLDLAGGRALLDLELKTLDRPYPGIVKTVRAAVARRALEDSVLVSSFNLETVREAKASGLATALIVPGAPTADEARRWGRVSDAFAVAAWAASAETLRLLAKPAYVWTVDSPTDARAFVAAGAAGVVTNDVRTMVRALGR